MTTPKKSEPRRHHYVRTCWLVGFTETGDQDGKLFVTDFKRGSQWGATPGPAGFIRDFYRLEDEGLSDPVMAESYLQHAEHYFRLIAAAQQAQQAAFGFPRPGNEPEAEDLEDDDDFAAIPDRFASPIERAPQPAQQPYAQQQPQLGQNGATGRESDVGFSRPFPTRPAPPGGRTDRGSRRFGEPRAGRTVHYVQAGIRGHLLPRCGRVR